VILYGLDSPENNRQPGKRCSHWHGSYFHGADFRLTVLLPLGLVNAGIMNLRQGVYVILGSEIGATITAQIVTFKVKMIFYPLMMADFTMSPPDSKEKVKNT